MSDIEIPYAYLDSLTVQAKRAISRAAHELYPGAALSLVDAPDSVLLPPLAIANHPRSELFLQAQILRERGELPEIPDDVLFLDIETHNAEKRWDMPREDFVRLVQYAWGEAPVQVSDDLAGLLAEMEKARVIVAHNGHSFDFSVLLGDRALDLALAHKLFDPYVYAEVVFPCPVNYVHANGTHYSNNTSPAQYRRWYSLDNLAYQFGSARKFGNLQELARKHNPKATPTAELDFGLIPVDDPQFLEYARQDIVALRELVRSMLAVRPLTDYDAREQIKAAINAQMTRNGVLIDVELAQGMVDAADQEREQVLADLVQRYDFPAQGKMPWRTKAGKQAIERVLADNGISIYATDWPQTATGNPSLSGDALVNGTKGTPAEPLGTALAQLQGQRPLAAQTLKYTDCEGRVHPDIDNLQRSGRASTTKPAVTTFGSRGDTRDKGYFIPDPGNVMISLDLSNADARAVAFMSGDKNRYKWFEPGADSHEIVGRLMFGDATYDSDPVYYRQTSKALNHAAAYGSGPYKLSVTAKVDLNTAEHFLDTIAEHYPKVILWQNQVREQGGSGWITNHWGREMPVEPDRAYTQSPALMGQSSTTEVLYDGLIRLAREYRPYMQYLCFTVHDEILIQAPKDSWQDVVNALLTCTEQDINGITFELAHGEPANSWREASH